MTESELLRFSYLNGKKQRSINSLTESEIREFLELLIKAQTEEIERLKGELQKAARTLTYAGFTDEGGELWKPPLGKSVTEYLDKIDELQAIVNRRQFVRVEDALPPIRLNSYQVLAISTKIHEGGNYDGQNKKTIVQDWVVRRWPTNFKYWACMPDDTEN